MSDASPYVLPKEVLAEFALWWKRIAPETASGTNKADRAVLRRCDTPLEVAKTAAFGRVWRALDAQRTGEPWREWQLDRLAAAVGLAAHLKWDAHATQPPPLAWAMGTLRDSQNKGSPPQVSELRFRRLLDSPSMPSLYTGVRRLLPLVNHRADPVGLLCDLYAWGDTTRKRWAYAYYDPAHITANLATPQP